jgi:beta-lactamase superfamily II metal-dependent hydrolase
MAAKKTAISHKTKTAAGKKPPEQARKNAAPAKARSRKKTAPVPGTAPATSAGPTNTAAGSRVTGLRVRMYRVGFGDFFLLTVPTDAGPKHILIDCGVHAGDIGSIKDAVEQMAKETGGNLALLIMTHRHADHISGFATCKDVFSQFTVERVWMSWFENPNDTNAVKFQSNLVAVAAQLKQALAARTDPDSKELTNMAENITGEPLGFGGASSNSVALGVLHGGFKNRPPIDYYQAGDQATLPQDLIDAGLGAQILGPPIDPALVSQMNGKNEQYLATNDQSNLTPIVPFARAFQTDAPHYPPVAVDHDAIEKSVNDAQPDLLAAKARQSDNTLNNQSLVVLFTFRGKTLLFVGDAQWGNWENFLFGGPVGTPGHTNLTDKSESILAAVDFYKVGHHGSTNATPIDAAGALRDGCVAMCSTQPGIYGSEARNTEVPRIPLLDALDKKTKNQLVRSDQIIAGTAKLDLKLGSPPLIFILGPDKKLFIDYDF